MPVTLYHVRVYGYHPLFLDCLAREFRILMMPAYQYKLTGLVKLLRWSSLHLLGSEPFSMNVEEKLECMKS